jgi:monomeric isocitrate dehydrogenase
MLSIVPLLAGGGLFETGMYVYNCRWLLSV